MSELQYLGQEIQQRLGSAEEKGRLLQSELQTKMADLEKRYAKFEELAIEIMTDVIDPRMDRLVSFFDNAKLLDRDDAGKFFCIGQFDHSARFPASVELTLSIAHDTEIKTLLLVYDLGILPVFFKFEAHDQAVFPLDDLDQKQVAEWVDEKILLFVDTYLRLEETEQYQQSSLVTDPVCGMRFRKSIASAEMKHAGHTFFFCSQICHEKFMADSQRFIAS